MAELVNARDLGSRERKLLGVRLSPSAPCVSGGTGQRAGFKPRCLRTCGFDSRLTHHRQQAGAALLVRPISASSRFDTGCWHCGVEERSSSRAP